MLAMVAAGVAEAAAQQGQTITGRVTDAASLSPLAGVRVGVDGATTATATGADGRFTIQAPGTATLVFSSLGYAEQRVAVENRSVINVTLTASAIQLEELVAVGVSQQSRATVSAAVASVNAADLEAQSALGTTSAMLAGMVPGLSVRLTTSLTGTQIGGPGGVIPGEGTDGRPGSASSISIRNMGDPLYVIDGIPSDAGSFNNLNAADIENISILKDAAAAVYGFRASNGVILVTTKKGGREQAPRVSIEGRYGLQNLTRFHYMRMFNAYEFLYNEVDSNTTLGSIVPVAQREQRAAELEKWRLGEEPGYQSTDYYDLSINNPNAPQYQLTANISGGSQSSTYYLSVGHQQQDYNIKDFTYGRSNLVANLSVDLSSNFRMGTELRAQQRVTDGVAVPASIGDDPDPVRTILFSVNSQWPNTYPFLGANDEFRAAATNNTTSIDGRTIRGTLRRADRHVGANNREVSGYTKNLLRDFVGSFWAEFTFPFGSTLRGTFNIDTDEREWDLVRRSYQLYCQDSVTNTILPCFDTGDRRREQLRSRGNSKFGNLTLSHTQQFGGHSFNGVAFMELSGNENGTTTLIGTSPTNYTTIIEQARVTEMQNTWGISRRASYGGQINYDYDQKYLITALGRYDGSYLYAPGQRWGFFPGFTLGWRVTEEPFLRDRFDFLDDLKVRASWGRTGSESGGAWSYLEGATYGVGEGSVFDGNVVTGARPRGAPNLTLSWLTNTTKNIGLDLLMFDSKVSLEMDFFERLRSGIPATRTGLNIPTEAAFPQPQENLNEDITRGFEAAIRWNDQVGRVRYSIAPNFTIARTRAGYREGERYGSEYDRYTATGGNTSRWNGAARGYTAIGQFQTIAEIEAYPVVIDNNANRNLLPGDLIFKDENGDGIINNLDQRTLGFDTGITPIVSYGAATSLSFEGLTLNVNWAGGAYFSHFRDYEMRYQGWSQHNGPSYGMDRWRRVDPFDPQSEWIPGRYPPLRINQTGGAYPSFNNVSNFWRTNVKFLRIRAIDLSFNVPDRIPAAVGLSGVRLFTNLTNPMSLDNTRHYMMDPEVRAVNGMVYPTIRMLQVGFRANVGGVQRPTVPVPTD